MIRILDRYLVREILPPFLLGLFVLTFTLLTNLIVKLTEWFINRGVGLGDVTRILLLSLPYLLVLALPMAVLVGILMALGRLSADSELVALRASGVSLYRIALPIFALAVLGYVATSYLYIKVLPETNLRLKQLRFEILKRQSDIGLKPNVFNTFFDDQVIYIDEIDAHGEMHGVFLSANDRDDTKVFFANRARRLVDEDKARVTLLLEDGIWHRSDLTKTGAYGVAPFDELSLNLELNTPAFTGEVEKGNREMTLAELRAAELQLEADIAAGLGHIELTRADPELSDVVRESRLRQMAGHIEFTRARIWRIQVEYHKKFAIPFACIIFAVIGVPLGIRGTRSGRSAGFAISLGLFILYYVLLVGGEGMGNEGKLPAALAVWGANLAFGLVGLLLILTVGRESHLGPLQALTRLWSRPPQQTSAGEGRSRPAARAAAPGIRPLSFPRILDLYIARDWLVLFFGVIVAITAITNVVHVFEKLDDFNRHNASLALVARYIAARTPGFGVITVHIAALVATVLTISGLNRRSELTAIRASGIPLLRVALPMMLLGLAVSGGVWVLNERIVPQTNRRANDIFDYEIRERKPTKLAFNRNWFRTARHSILYYTVREGHEDGRVTLNRFTLFRLGPRGLPILRVEADRAMWNPDAETWFYEMATVRTFDDWGQFQSQAQYETIEADLEARPEEFEREIGSSEEMNYWQLADFIRSVEAQGHSAVGYRVDLMGKISFCLISFVMVLVGFPLAAASNRSGKLAWGIVISIVVGVTFFVAFRIGISLGQSGKLEPLTAAFLPLAAYLLAGFLLLLRME
jgi:LPS export ABC transporter permease LptF/LPS export ABC transporter permease LptG